MSWGVPKIGAVAAVASGNLTLAEPAGIAAGNLMIACIGYRSNAAFTVPGDWNLVATQQSSGDVDATNGIASGLMMWCIRGGSAPTLTFNRTAGDVAQGQIIAYSGAHSSPYDTGSANTLGSASATVTTGTFNTAEAGELIVAMVSCGDNLTTSAFDAATNPTTASGATDTTTAPTAGTWIERADTGTGTGADHGLAIADAIRSAAGATGTIQATVSASAQHVMIAAAFKPALIPTVTTQAVSSIGETTATGNGNVTSDGGNTVTERGVVANTTGTPTTSDLKFAAGAGGTGAFTASMTGLTAGQHYFVRAYAINAIGTSYGSEVTFDTDASTSALTHIMGVAVGGISAMLGVTYSTLSHVLGVAIGLGGGSLTFDTNAEFSGGGTDAVARINAGNYAGVVDATPTSASDVSYTFKFNSVPAANDGACFVYLNDGTNSLGMTFVGTGAGSAKLNGAYDGDLLGGATGIWDDTSTFKIERISTVVKLYKGVTLLYTFGTASSGTAKLRVEAPKEAVNIGFGVNTAAYA